MKTILFYFLLTILAVSCQLKQSENTEKEVSDNVSNSDTEECIADTISATAIFWIDKAETKHCKEWGFRTVKAKVLIHENGKVDLEAFVKKQSPDMEKYVRHHLAKFQVSEKCWKADMCNRVNSSFSFVAYMGKSKQSKTPLLFQQGTISPDRSDLMFRALETPVPRLETVVSYAGNRSF